MASVHWDQGWTLDMGERRLLTWTIVIIVTLQLYTAINKTWLKLHFKLSDLSLHLNLFES